jgi:hypothetical protein
MEHGMAGNVNKDGGRSYVQVRHIRHIRHWVMLDNETARQLMEIVRIERAWGRQVDDEDVLRAMVRVGYRMRAIEAHIATPLVHQHK